MGVGSADVGRGWLPVRDRSGRVAATGPAVGACSAAIGAVGAAGVTTSLTPVAAAAPVAGPGSRPGLSSIGAVSTRSAAADSAGWAAVSVDQVIACRCTAARGLLGAGTASAVEAA